MTGADGVISEEQRHSLPGDGLPEYDEYDPSTAPNATGDLRSQSQENQERGPSQAPSNDKDWVETLRELQTNLNELKQAKRTPFFSTANPVLRKATNFSSFSRGKRSKKGKEPADADLGSINEQLEDQERLQNIRVHEQLILEGMRRLARTHPEPTTQAEWASRADNFSRTLEEAKKAGKDTLESTEEDSILADIGKGLALLVLAPLGALSAAVVFASGSILFGTGKLIVGIGHAMTFGKLK